MPTEKTTTSESVVSSLHTTTSKPDNNIIDEPMTTDFIYVLAGIGGVVPWLYQSDQSGCSIGGVYSASLNATSNERKAEIR